jgi:hypothetical protein
MFYLVVRGDASKDNYNVYRFDNRCLSRDSDFDAWLAAQTPTKWLVSINGRKNLKWFLENHVCQEDTIAFDVEVGNKVSFRNIDHDPDSRVWRVDVTKQKFPIL